MICTACQKAEAVVFIKQLINNQVTQAALCADCAAREKVPLDPVHPFNALLQLLAKPQAPRAPARCPGCGTTWAEFRASGRFGCSRCYEHFSQPLRAIIPRIHAGAYAHRGKCPKRGAGTE